jgi:hypothetical protein
MAKNQNSRPRAAQNVAAAQPKLGAEPNSYKTKKPVWRFSSFDWDGPWGLAVCQDINWRAHIEQHLASFETMTWAEIESAAGGRRHGTNSHPLARDKFSRDARRRLDEIRIFSDAFFSLRLNATVRVYGVREDNCLRIIWIDPFHEEGNQQAAYAW